MLTGVRPMPRPRCADYHPSPGSECPCGTGRQSRQLPRGSWLGQLKTYDLHEAPALTPGSNQDRRWSARKVRGASFVPRSLWSGFDLRQSFRWSQPARVTPDGDNRSQDPLVLITIFHHHYSSPLIITLFLTGTGPRPSRLARWIRHRPWQQAIRQTERRGRSRARCARPRWPAARRARIRVSPRHARPQ